MHLHFKLIEMIKRVSNNLGGAYQKKYEETNNSKYLINATKYYEDSVLAFDKLINYIGSEVDLNTIDITTTEPEEYSKYKRERAHINLRMVLYPDAGIDDPILYEDFPLEYDVYM